MNTKHQAVELAQMQRADGEVMPPAAAALMRPSAQPYIMQASNEALPPHAWIIALAVVLGIPAILAVSMLFMGAPGWVSLVSWFLLVCPAVYWTLQLMSGDWAFMQNSRAYFKYLSKELNHRAEIEKMKETHRHTEQIMEYENERARIAATVADDTMHRVIMGLQATVARLADAHDVRTTIAQPSTYVPATPQIAVSKAKKWVAEMMAESTDGMAPQLAKVGMPWNAAWKGEPWAGDARQWLLDNVLEQHGTVYRWRDEFATVAEAQGTLRRL